MLAVQGKYSSAGQWVSEKRNVKQDLKKIFGEDINEIDVVAVMTDTDDSGRSTSAWYGDIYCSSEYNFFPLFAILQVIYGYCKITSPIQPG